MVYLQQFTSFFLFLLPFEVTIDKFHTSENMDLQHNFALSCKGKRILKWWQGFQRLKKKREVV
jgi:hypothetical protein